MSQREVEFVPYFEDSSPHPMYLGFGSGPMECVRVDDPVLRPIWFGAPDLGWGADGRYAVYSRPAKNTFILVRLEADGEYRITRELNSSRPLSPGDVNLLIRWLVSNDTRRGFDVLKFIDEKNAALDREKERKADEERAQISDKLAWALKRDLASHVGGSRFDHAIGDVPWHEEKVAAEGVS